MPGTPTALAATANLTTRDYSSFKFRSEVDFLMLDLNLKVLTNAWSVRKALDITYAEALNAVPGGAASRFRIRIDDPKSWRSVREIAAKAEANYGLASSPQIVTIEVSFDGYSRTQGAESLQALAAHFFQMGAINSDNIRLTGPVGTPVGGPAFMPPAETARKLGQGLVLQAGNKHDPIRQRIYVKTTDQAGKVNLPVEKHRARIEVTLTSPMCPVDLLSDCQSFSFQALSKWFRFRQSSSSARYRSALARLLLARTPMAGTREARPGRVLYNKQTAADTALNRRAYYALRDLSRRMRT